MLVLLPQGGQRSEIASLKQAGNQSHLSIVAAPWHTVDVSGLLHGFTLIVLGNCGDQNTAESRPQRKTLCSFCHLLSRIPQSNYQNSQNVFLYFSFSSLFLSFAMSHFVPPNIWLWFCYIRQLREYLVQQPIIGMWSESQTRERV